VGNDRVLMAGAEQKLAFKTIPPTACFNTGKLYTWPTGVTLTVATDCIAIQHGIGHCEHANVLL